MQKENVKSNINISPVIDKSATLFSPATVQVFSFFSGLGFLDLGFEKAGFDIAFVNEINPQFLKAYQFARRHSCSSPELGYSSRSAEEFLDDSVWNSVVQNRKAGLIGFIGGPPCPDFSAAGKNKGHTGEHGILTDIYAKLIIKRTPDFFVLENVKGLYQTQKHKDFYGLVKKRLYKAGYSLFDSIENALEYGVPQDRDRLILIGFKRQTFGNRIAFDQKYSKRYLLSEICQKSWPRKENFIEDSQKEKPINIISELTVEYWFKNNDVTNHANGNDYFNIKKEERYKIIKEGDSSGKSFKRLHRWRYSPTAAYGNNEVHLHPYKRRRISVAEALAIQSIPATFELPSDISLSAKFKMVGNGVPFLMANAIACKILEFIQIHQNIKKSDSNNG